MARSVHGGVFVLACVTAFLGGIALAAQSRVNGFMADHTGDALLAAAYTFVTGWLLLTIGLLLQSPREGLRRAYAAYRAGEVRAWVFFAGFFGAFWVASQALAVPLAGVALFTIGAVAGQTGGALVVDRAGLGPAGKRAVSPARAGATLLAIGGVALAVSGRFGVTGLTVLLPVMIAVAGGAAIAVSAANNGRINVASRDFVATSWINFTWGSAALVAICLARLATGVVTWPDWSGAPWWAYSAGILGVLYVANSSVVVRHLGVLLLMLMTLTGQMSGALLLDLVNPVTRAYITPTLIAGVTVTLAAALLAAWAANRSPAVR